MAFQIEKGIEPIPGYRLVRVLGRGGFGEVWEAEAPGGIRKAMKFVFGDLNSLSSASPCAEQELRSLTRVKGVRHPFLLSLERVDLVEGHVVIVTELADQDLLVRFHAYRKQNLPGIPRVELLRYMEETAEVLDLMNQTHDLQHMDIKPQNLCLLHNHIKVADFGLVKDLSGLMTSMTGGMTPKYAAPETFRGMVSRFTDHDHEPPRPSEGCRGKSSSKNRRHSSLCPSRLRAFGRNEVGRAAEPVRPAFPGQPTSFVRTPYGADVGQSVAGPESCFGGFLSMRAFLASPSEGSSANSAANSCS